jgi:hypothetical protein
MIWLRFLHRVEMHSETFDIDEVHKRADQFKGSEEELVGLPKKI